MDNGKEYLRRTRKGHEHLFGDHRAINRVRAFGGLSNTPTRRDGSFDENAPNILDVEKAVEFLSLSRKPDFNENDLGTLFDCLESALYVYDYHGKKTAGKDEDAGAKARYRFFEAFTSAFGEILFNKSPKTEAEIEGVLTLGEAIIDALRGIKDEDFKARAILSTLLMMQMFQDLRGSFTPEGKKIGIAEIEDGFESDDALRVKFESVFENRKGLPQATLSETLYRKFLVSAFIDEQVFKRYFHEIENEVYTPARAKEWDARFNELCDAYGEAGYKRNFSDEFYQKHTPSKYCPELCFYSTHLNGEDFQAYAQEEVLLLADRLGLGRGIVKQAEYLEDTYGRTDAEITEIKEHLDDPDGLQDFLEEKEQ